jgi:hypothetical protein
MTPIFGLRPPEAMILLSLLARTKASMASRLWSCRRASCASTGSRRRMLSPPSGMAKSVGMTMLTRSRLPSITAVDSIVSCIDLSATHAPVKRDIAQP